MKDNLLISIIIPVYNVDKYLNQCLDSLLIQSMIDNIEVICVNDGSNDNSLNILKSYENKFKNFVILNQKNAGVSNARNNGLEIAQGKYISFLDSDDYIIKKNYFELIMTKLESCHSDIMILNHHILDSNNFISEISCKKKEKIYTPKEYILIDGGRRFTVVVWDKIFRKNYLKDINFKFEENIYHEDDEAIIRLFYYAEKVIHFNISGYVYRIRSGSVMNQKKNLKHFKGYLKILNTYSMFYEIENDKVFKKYLKGRIYIYMLLLISIIDPKNNNYSEIMKQCDLIKEKFFNDFINKTFIKYDEKYIKIFNGFRRKISISYMVRKIRQFYYNN